MLVKQYQTMEESKREMFMNSEWSPDKNEAFLKEFEDKPNPYHGTLKDLIDLTPRDRISKIYLEHKMFQTWFYKRSVLVGDGMCNDCMDDMALARFCFDSDTFLFLFFCLLIISLP